MWHANSAIDEPHPEAGNVIFFILLGIVLLGLVTAAMRSGGLEGSNIDRESVSIGLSRMKDQANAIERGVAFILQNGASESDLRFAHADAASEYGNDPTVTPQFQLFNRAGGGVEYLSPPVGINDGSNWEFFGNSHLPQVGSALPDLIAVLPNLTEAACTAINRQAGYTGTPTDDGGASGSSDCIDSAASDRFSSTTQFPGIASNTTNEASFSLKPAMQGCITCSVDGSRHYYRVLLAR
ncbi:MAG: hypothetical protein ACK4NR_01300 [Micavibrio sp.]